ncbi:preprotein translocase subunit SecA, partial [Klebsiella pneumoniae]|nr:preprotein translocase subunit SecA [Klebsiella pneumoniae]
DRFGMDDSTPIQSKMVSRAVVSSQKRVEGNNFDARKQPLQYDDVLRQQREVIYKQRFEVIDSDNLRSIVENMIKSSLERTVASYTPKEELPEEWNLDGLVEQINSNFLDEGALEKSDIFGKESEEITELVFDRIKTKYDEKEERFGSEQMREFEKVIVLREVDTKWM